MVGVRVRDEVVVDFRNGKAQEGEGFGSPRTAIDEDVGVSLYDEDIVLEESFREGATYADEGEVEAAIVGEGQDRLFPDASVCAHSLQYSTSPPRDSKLQAKERLRYPAGSARL